MAATTTATPGNRPHWKDRGIAMAGAISDAYDVLMAYAGHSSRFILITCMIANILEVIPTIHLPEVAVNTVLVVQVLTLDIGGLSLSSMAKHAKEQGDAQAARTAGATSMLLIGLTMATLVLVSIGTIWPSTKTWTGTAEQVLILVRIAMVIVYSHVVHSLREALQKHQQKQADQAAEIARLQHEVSERAARVVALEQDTLAAQQEAAKALQNTQALATKITELETLTATLEEQKSATETAFLALQEQHKNDTLSSTGDDTESDTASATNIRILRTQKRYSSATKSDTSSSADKAAKALRLITKNNAIGATELAQKAQISVSYARQLLNKHRSHQEAIHA